MHTWYSPGISRGNQALDDGHMKRRPSEMAEMKKAGVWVQGNGIVFGGKWSCCRRVEEGCGGVGGGVGGSEERFPRCLLGRGIGGVGWWVLASSMERFPRERGSLERAASSRGRTTISQLLFFFGRVACVSIFDLLFVTYSYINLRPRGL